MFKNRVIRNIFIVVLVLAVFFPLINVYMIYPSFTQLLIENTENEAIRVGEHLTEMYFKTDKPLTREDMAVIGDTSVQEHKNNFNLMKLKVFAPDGETIYSTSAKDIGKMNTHDYFHNVVAKGRPFTKVVKKDMQSLEGQTVSADVVESYVPIMSGDSFIGAFEIYYDITSRNEKLQNVVFTSSLIPFGMALGWIILAAVVLIKLDRIMSALKATKQEVQTYADKLERSNRELQDFAHVASHDLQEPLRKITAFGDRLQSKYGEALGEKGQDYLGRMQSAASRMQRLIQGLLSFSRVTTKAKPFEAVDLNNVATEVLSDLEVRIQETGGQVEVNTMPTLSADPLQMRQLLQNLIGNALKFHREDEQPVIRVSASEQTVHPAVNAGSASFQIVIEDNGIGFDEKYADRIFGVFQRLHGRQEYEGSGIGLSVCRRIVERHGGNIEAHSAPGEGATFTITLPAEHEEDASNEQG